MRQCFYHKHYLKGKKIGCLNLSKLKLMHCELNSTGVIYDYLKSTVRVFERNETFPQRLRFVSPRVTP